MKSFDDYRKELTMPQLLVSANCCRHAFEAGQQSKQAEIDELQKRIDLFDKMILSLRNEFNLWADDTESFNAIEAQIENLEELSK